MKAGIFLLLFIHLFSGILQAQQTRGIKPIATKSNAKGTTRAIVIGISDYQNPLINDLKYAHKDAEEFAKFLISAAGGSVKPENVKLLLNEQATGSQINLALEWLTDSCKAGDQAIFYFAGHGDVESKEYDQPGFLLPWDSRERSYWMNALKVSDLQGLINKLSIDKKTKVMVITDACRSGKLAGSPDGPRITANALLDLF